MLLMRSWKSMGFRSAGSNSSTSRAAHPASPCDPKLPRFSEINAIIMSPMFSFGQITNAFTIGSSIFWM